MSLSIRITDPSEAEELSQIQKAAFKPLYEKYHDEGNPFLRGPEDILRRLNKFNRHFTILYNDKVVGGVFYRLYGKRSPTDEIGAGEYYLARIYIHPDYQNKGIARDAIILCEKEFPDARFYYVDFPEDMEKNRRCYQSAGYCDTGDRICTDGAPALAMFKKTVSDVFEPAGVSLPMIYEVDKNELQECLQNRFCCKNMRILKVNRLRIRLIYVDNSILPYSGLSPPCCIACRAHHKSPRPSLLQHGAGFVSGRRL